MKYQYWLSNIEGIGPKTIQKLLEQVSCAEELYHLTEKQLLSLQNIKDKEKVKLLESKRYWNLEREVEILQRKNIGFLSMESKEFPEKLRYIDSPPYSIYYKGHIPNESYKSVAIVGARQCSEYGRVMSEKIAEALANYQIEIISGMARGVDSYAHIGALRGKGKTFAILGCGVDVCYPAENRKLYEELMEYGGILSEYPPGTSPKPQFFPLRNRIISAFSDIVILVEAKEKSGSLITADYALEQGKDIFACPGRATDALSLGCNALIRQGAGIVTSVDSLLKDLGLVRPISSVSEPCFEKIQNLSLEKDESLVYSCLDFRPQSLDEISLKSGMKTSYLYGVIQRMIEKEIVKEIFRNYYIRS